MRYAREGERWGRGRFSKRSASPPDPLSRRVAGNRLVCSFGGSLPCEVGAVSCCLVVVTAADRAAATCQRWVTTNYRKRAGEGFQRAIAKPPDGLRPLVVPAGTKSRLRGGGPPPHGRGGSVSRRDLNQLAGIHTHLSGGTTYAEARNSNASRSSGGSAREGLLSEKPPPSHPPRRLSLLRIWFVAYAPAAELVDGALDSVLGVVPRLVLIAVVKFEREPLNVLFGAGEIVTGQACDHLHKG